MFGLPSKDYIQVCIHTCKIFCRREHLSQEDVQKNKAMMENLSKGSWDNKEVSSHLYMFSSKTTKNKQQTTILNFCYC